MARLVLLGAGLLLAAAALLSPDQRRGYEIFVCCETVEVQRTSWWGSGGPSRSTLDAGGTRYRASGDFGPAGTVREVKAAVRALLAESQATVVGDRAPADLDERIRRIYARELAAEEIRVAHRVFDEYGPVTGGVTVVDRFAGVLADRTGAAVLALGRERWDEAGHRGKTAAVFWWVRLVREGGRWKIAQLDSGRPNSGDRPDWVPTT